MITDNDKKILEAQERFSINKLRGMSPKNKNYVYIVLVADPGVSGKFFYLDIITSTGSVNVHDAHCVYLHEQVSKLDSTFIAPGLTIYVKRIDQGGSFIAAHHISERTPALMHDLVYFPYSTLRALAMSAGAKFLGYPEVKNEFSHLVRTEIDTFKYIP